MHATQRSSRRRRLAVSGLDTVVPFDRHQVSQAADRQPFFITLAAVDQSVNMLGQDLSGLHCDRLITGLHLQIDGQRALDSGRRDDGFHGIGRLRLESLRRVALCDPWSRFLLPAKPTACHAGRGSQSGTRTDCPIKAERGAMVPSGPFATRPACPTIGTSGFRACAEPSNRGSSKPKSSSRRYQSG